MEYVPVATICLDTQRQVLAKIFRNLDLARDIQFDYAVRPGSIDLTGVFDDSHHSEDIPLSNDTSFGVGYAPYSDVEKITLEAEYLINSPSFKDKCKGSGEDVKVMVERIDNKVGITVAAAMVSKYINDADEYVNYSNQIKDAVLDLAAKIIPEREVTCQVNVADNIDKGILYLTITGTSAEAGDDGEVGRGNRSNGLITPCRTMSLEAVCGKNPINHVGSITAKKIQKHITKNPDLINADILTIIELPFPEVEKNWNAKDISNLLIKYPAVLVKENNNFIGIITDADFLKLTSK